MRQLEAGLSFFVDHKARIGRNCGIEPSDDFPDALLPVRVEREKAHGLRQEQQHQQAVTIGRTRR
jgi:hypothetical protein